MEVDWTTSPSAYSAEVAFGYEGWKGEVETAGDRPGGEGGGDTAISARLKTDRGPV